MLTDWLRRCQDVLEGIVDEHNAPAYLQERLAQKIGQIYAQHANHKPETLVMDVWIPQAVEALRPDFNHRRIALEQTLEPVPAVVLPEPLLFKSFRGLLRNAIEATPDGGTISLVLREANGNVQARYSRHRRRDRHGTTRTSIPWLHPCGRHRSLFVGPTLRLRRRRQGPRPAAPQAFFGALWFQALFRQQGRRRQRIFARISPGPIEAA